MNKNYLSRRENDVMQALWEAGKPLSAADIVQQTGLSQAAILPVLKRLIDKNYVEVASIIPHAKTYIRVFRAIKGKDEIIKNEIQTYMQVLENPLSFSRTIMTAILDGAKDSKETIQELEKLIEEKKNGN